MVAIIFFLLRDNGPVLAPVPPPPSISGVPPPHSSSSAPRSGVPPPHSTSSAKTHYSTSSAPHSSHAPFPPHIQVYFILQPVIVEVS